MRWQLATELPFGGGGVTKRTSVGKYEMDIVSTGDYGVQRSRNLL